MTEKDGNVKINKKLGIIWMLLIVILVVGGQIAFLIALYSL